MPYNDYFRNTRMPRDLHGFAEKAIEIAGQTGERKRQFKTQAASNLAQSRMAELERTQTGATKRQTMIEAGKEKQHEREYGRTWGTRPEAQRGRLRSTGGGVGSFTPSQMANLRKSAYGEADKEIVRRREMGELSFGSGKNRVNMTSEQIAKERESIAAGYLQDYTGSGMQRAEEQQPVDDGMQGRGRVVTEGGRQFDIMPGAEGFQRSMALPGMMEAAGFLPQIPAKKLARGVAGEEPGAIGEMPGAIGAGGTQGIVPGIPKLKPGEAAARLQAEYNKENPDPDIIASLKKIIGGGMQWLGGKMLSPEGSYVGSPVGLKGYMDR